MLMALILAIRPKGTVGRPLVLESMNRTLESSKTIEGYRRVYDR
jgi:hypothetical protein